MEIIIKGNSVSLVSGSHPLSGGIGPFLDSVMKEEGIDFHKKISKIGFHPAVCLFKMFDEANVNRV